MTTRRMFLTQAAGALAGLGFSGMPISASRAAGAQPPRPNFVFLFCDDLGYGDLACFGHPTIQTPSLDRLAREGMKLTDCYAAQPVCSPSRAGALTGRNPYRCHIPDWIPSGSPLHLQRPEITVAKLLRQAGYHTIHCGKWHLNGGFDLGQPDPGDHGFEHWFSTQNNAVPSHHNPKNFYKNGKSVGQIEGYSSAIIVDESIRAIQSVPEGEPFALFVWFHSPHEPIATSDEFMNWYASEPDETKRSYFGNVSQMDHACGRLLDYLDDNRLRDQTVVMFTSDNGPETLNRYKGSHRSHGSPGPLRGMKLHLYDGGIRVPGILRIPGKTPAGTVCGEAVNGTDILPTFCELANVSAPTDRAIDGASLTPIFEGKPIHRSRPLYWRYDRAISRPKLAMRQGDWKILSDLQFSTFELYHLREDIGETTDLAQREPDRLKQMANTLREIHREVENDPISEFIHDPRDDKG